MQRSKRGSCWMFVGLSVCSINCGGVEGVTLPDAMSSNDAAVDAGPQPVRYAITIVAAPGATGVGFGDADAAVNGVLGGGQNNGSTDVYSLRFAPALNTSITLRWANATLINGPGEDFAVFENGFDTDVGPFMDLLIVEVSRDGVQWRTLAHDYVTTDERIYVRDRAAWQGFAGKTPVLLNDQTNPVNPFDRLAAGGDGFDLDTIVDEGSGVDAEAVAMRRDGIVMIRLTTAPSLQNPDTAQGFVFDSYSNGADIDGVAGRYVTDIR